MQTPDSTALSFDERLGLLVDREMTARAPRRLTTRFRPAKLRQSAWRAALDYRQARGLETGRMASLATCQGVRAPRNVLITGPTGVGTTWMACALGQQACRHGCTTLSLRLPMLLQALPIARGDGRTPTLLATLAKTELRLRDAWGLAALRDEQRRDLLELLAERHDRRATLVTSQLPVEQGPEAMGEPTRAAAILDRLVHNADKIAWHGASMRQPQATLPRGAVANSQEKPGVAVLRWGQTSPGGGGRLPVDSVAIFPWMRWQASRGWSGRNPWNTQDDAVDHASCGIWCFCLRC